MKTSPLEFFENYQLKARSKQVEVLEHMHQEWDNYKYFLLSCPTGVGKTYIATAIASVIKNAYLLTSTLQLQEQYENAWKPIVNLKGRGNYTCALNREFTVDAAPCTGCVELAQACRRDRTCDYMNQKAKALAAPAMITNPVYFLYSTHCGFGSDDPADNPWIKRTALIIDEAHNMEKHLCSFAESKIEPLKLHEEHGVKGANKIKFTGDLEHDYSELTLLMELMKVRAEELAEKLATEFPKPSAGSERAWAKNMSKSVAEKARKLNARIYALDKTIQPLNIFFDTHESIAELEERWLLSADVGENTIQLSPLRGGFLFNEYMDKMGEKFILLSATLGDKAQLCAELGIPEHEALFIETDTPFPPELSPIISLPRLNMGYANINQSLQPMAELVKDILQGHEQERGIIHSATYKLQDELFKRSSKATRSRFLARDMEAMGDSPPRYPKRLNNAELLKLHGARTDSILLSPSMMEGVDLFDDLSLFQIILKMPWTSLADPRIKRKSEIEPDWYTNQVWISIMQASGRSTRNDTDSSVTYILDRSFPYFYSQWKHRLPKWFTSRVIIEK